MPLNPRPMLQNLYVATTILNKTTPCAQRHRRPLPQPHLTFIVPTYHKYILTLLFSVNKEIVVRLKWGQTEYRGVLVSIDSYMNIQLTNTQEYIDQKMTATLGQVLIRCNNVLWIQGAPMDGKEQEKIEPKKDVEMEG